MVPKPLVYLLLFYIFSIPIETAFVVIPGYSLANSAGILWMVIFLFYYAQGKIVFRKVPIIINIYIIPVFISVFVAIDSEIVLHALVTYILLLITTYLFASTVLDKKTIMLAMLMFILSSFIFIINVLINYQQVKIVLWWDPRTSAMGADSNTLAVILSVANVLLFLLKKYYNQKAFKALLVAFSILFPIAIILTGSRTGAIVGLISYIPIVFVLRKRKFQLLLILAITYFAIYFTSLGKSLPQFNLNRIVETNERIREGNYTNREIFWKMAIDEFLEHPVLGIGSKNFSYYANNKLNATGAVTHNTYLSILVETGIVGLIIFLLLLYSIFLNIKNKWGPDRIYGFSLLLVICIGMLTLTMEYYKFIWFFYIFIFTYGRLNRVSTYTIKIENSTIQKKTFIHKDEPLTL